MIRDGFQLVPIFFSYLNWLGSGTQLGEELLGSQQLYVDGGMQLHAEALGPVHLPFLIDPGVGAEPEGSAKWAMDGEGRDHLV